MDEPYNPYAPPKAAVSARAYGPTGQLWRSGKLLKMEVNATLPGRCVKCNAPAVEPIKRRTYSWHSPGWYALIVLGLLAYVIVALVVRKKAQVSPGLCPAHHGARNRNILIAWLAFFAGVGVIFWGMDSKNDYYGYLAGGLMLFGLVIGVGFTKIITPTHMDNRVLTFSGCGEAFLRELPFVQEQRF
jgi:hypothetical protein